MQALHPLQWSCCATFSLLAALSITVDSHTITTRNTVDLQVRTWGGTPRARLSPSAFGHSGWLVAGWGRGTPAKPPQPTQPPPLLPPCHPPPPLPPAPTLRRHVLSCLLPPAHTSRDLYHCRDFQPYSNPRLFLPPALLLLQGLAPWQLTAERSKWWWCRTAKRRRRGQSSSALAT